MIDIEFNLDQTITIIKAKPGDIFQNAINNYLKKTLLNSESISLIVNGKTVNPSQTVESHMNELNKKNKKIKVLVNIIEGDKEDKEQIIVESKVIICPKCKEPCRINFEDYKIKLFDCAKGHKTEDIKIPEFSDTQKINVSQIICEKCKFKNKGNCPDNEFYRCMTCKQNLCLLCQSKHDRRHSTIQYDKKYYICENHNETLIKFCKQCNTNICFSCEDHDKHETVSLGDLKPNMEEKKKVLNEMKAVIDAIDKKIKEVIDILNRFSNALKVYYDINNKIINNYDVKSRNYQVLQNLKEISLNNKIYQKLKNINEDKEIENITNKIINLYESLKYGKEIAKNKKTDEITIIYDASNKDKIKIFNDRFVYNNRTKCNIKINDEKKDLCSNLELNKANQKTIEIKLQGINNITNAFEMFCNCKYLISLPDISNWDTKNINNMNGMFYNCRSLSSLSGISEWDVQNVTDMSYMFSDCSSLSSLPDISKWDTKNVTEMDSMFRNCDSLTSIPDISKWDIKNVTNMSSMFSNCSSLKSFPDISKWAINKNLYKYNMFNGVNTNLPKNF